MALAMGCGAVALAGGIGSLLVARADKLKAIRQARREAKPFRLGAEK